MPEHQPADSSTLAESAAPGVDDPVARELRGPGAALPMPEQPEPTHAAYTSRRELYGLDKPMPEQQPDAVSPEVRRIIDARAIVLMGGENAEQWVRDLAATPIPQDAPAAIEAHPDAVTAIAEVIDTFDLLWVDGATPHDIARVLLESGVVVLTADVVALPDVEKPYRDEAGNLRCGVQFDPLGGPGCVTADELRASAAFYVRQAAQRLAAAAYLDDELRALAGGES